MQTSARVQTRPGTEDGHRGAAGVGTEWERHGPGRANCNPSPAGCGSQTRGTATLCNNWRFACSPARPPPAGKLAAKGRTLRSESVSGCQTISGQCGGLEYPWHGLAQCWSTEPVTTGEHRTSGLALGCCPVPGALKPQGMLKQFRLCAPICPL